MNIEPGLYIHYKSEDKRYEVLGTGRDTETDEEYVVYRPLYVTENQPNFWIRPIEQFLGTVVVKGETLPRFRRVDE